MSLSTRQKVVFSPGIAHRLVVRLVLVLYTNAFYATYRFTTNNNSIQSRSQGMDRSGRAGAPYPSGIDGYDGYVPGYTRDKRCP